MLALIASQLLLVVSHDAAARGQLTLLERYADRVSLTISLGGGDAISDSAIEALRRWPALVAVELFVPLKEREAARLRQLKRLTVRLPPPAPPNEPPFISLKLALKEAPSLALLGPALVRVERSAASTLAPGPCPGSEERVLPDGSSELRLEGPIDRCELDWLHAHLDPRAEGADERWPAQATQPPAPPPGEAK